MSIYVDMYHADIGCCTTLYADVKEKDISIKIK